MNIDQSSEIRNALTYEAICNLRQPLTAMMGHAQLALRRARRFGGYSENEMHLEAILEQGWRLAGMLRQLAGEEGEIKCR